MFDKFHSTYYLLVLSLPNLISPLHQNHSSESYLSSYLFDDILIIGSDPQAVTTFVHDLNRTFALKYLVEVNYFLGIQLSSLLDGGLHLSQQNYFADLLSRAKVQHAKSINSSITSGQKLAAFGSSPMKDVQLYRSIVGALQYATITRQENNVFC